MSAEMSLRADDRDEQSVVTHASHILAPTGKAFRHLGGWPLVGSGGRSAASFYTLVWASLNAVRGACLAPPNKAQRIEFGPGALSPLALRRLPQSVLVVSAGMAGHPNAAPSTRYSRTTASSNSTPMPGRSRTCAIPSPSTSMPSPPKRFMFIGVSGSAYSR